MKLISNLNPYAQSYIPLAKREANNENQDDNDTTACVVGSNVGGVQKHSVAEDPKLKGQEIDVPHGVSPQNPHGIADERFMDDEFAINLTYLRMIFPALSDQSLIDVYDVNVGDLEATVEMLSQLESLTDDSIDGLPEALDIGDVPQSVPSGECSSAG
ncbi:hypothetical protein Dimus_019327 [Dionaea muscipula]